MCEGGDKMSNRLDNFSIRQLIVVAGIPSKSKCVSPFPWICGPIIDARIKN